MAACSHVNICRLYGVTINGLDYSLVMEYCAGELSCRFPCLSPRPSMALLPAQKPIKSLHALTAGGALSGTLERCQLTPSVIIDWAIQVCLSLLSPYFIA